jgi:plastocyanin
VTSRTIDLRRAIAASALAAAAACGGGGGGNPTGPGPSTGSPGPSGATITISSTGTISPASVTINSGESVTFVNNDMRAGISHNMSSDPHPAHSDCPAINALGVISPGTSRLTNALTTSRTCGFHDHNDDTNPNLKGTITVR